MDGVRDYWCTRLHIMYCMHHMQSQGLQVKSEKIEYCTKCSVPQRLEKYVQKAVLVSKDNCTDRQRAEESAGIWPTVWLLYYTV